MHPLCCIISLESSPGIGNRSPDPYSLSRTRSLPVAVAEGGNAGGGSESTVAGVLYKWTNFGKGWRSRWFILRNGVLSYSKIRCPENQKLLTPAASADVRLIGKISTTAAMRRKHHKTSSSSGVVHLKIWSFRESKSDDRRFYIFTARKTLHLRTESRKDRVAWIQALVATRGLHPLINNHIVSVSTQRLKTRLLQEGTDENLVKDCEQIMLSEFHQIQSQLQLLSQERSNLLHTITHLEAANIEADASAMHDGEYQLTKNDFSSLGAGKYSESSTTTESSEDIETQEMMDPEEVCDEDESSSSYYDTIEYFTTGSMDDELEKSKSSLRETNTNSHYYCCMHNNVEEEEEESSMNDDEIEGRRRRSKLPEAAEKEKGVSLWSMIKDNVGKDLTRVCLPVYFNEPISSLQKCCEDFEYSYLLDRAYHYGKSGNSLLRALNVAAFAVSGYASSQGRHCKPFNPLLGETYEADFPDKGIRFFSEKVSHHPTVVACHCEGRGWKFWADSNIRSKFWGRSIQLDPVGLLTLQFDDGEIFQWSKVTTTIYNLILGKIYCDHHGDMDIRGNRHYSCRLKFKEQTFLDRNPHQVHGFVEDVTGKKAATLFGKWDESMYYVSGDVNVNVKARNLSSSSNASSSLLWERTMPPTNLTRYNMTSFAITLNELTPGLKLFLIPGVII